MNTHFYRGLASAYQQVQLNEHRSRSSTSARERMAEIYAGRYGTRTTYAGRKVARDEPDDAEQLRQAETIRKTLQQRQAASSRQRLKSKNAVPTKQGKKLFDEFMREAHAKNPIQELTRTQLDELRNAYNAAQHLDFGRWTLFVTEML